MCRNQVAYVLNIFKTLLPFAERLRHEALMLYVINAFLQVGLEC